MTPGFAFQMWNQADLAQTLFRGCTHQSADTARCHSAAWCSQLVGPGPGHVFFPAWDSRRNTTIFVCLMGSPLDTHPLRIVGLFGHTHPYWSPQHGSHTSGSAPPKKRNRNKRSQQGSLTKDSLPPTSIMGRHLEDQLPIEGTPCQVLCS